MDTAVTFRVQGMADRRLKGIGTNKKLWGFDIEVFAGSTPTLSIKHQVVTGV